MENGFRKAAHTADVDMECCTASLKSFIVTAVSTTLSLISLIPQTLYGFGFQTDTLEFQTYHSVLC